MSTLIGQPVSRLDGHAKVTGAARYSADTPVNDVLFAVLVASTIPCGRVTHIDTTAAAADPGVVRIFTHENTPKLAILPSPPAGQALMPLQSDGILYEGQPIALVVADSLERATAAA